MVPGVGQEHCQLEKVRGNVEAQRECQRYLQQCEQRRTGQFLSLQAQSVRYRITTGA